MGVDAVQRYFILGGVLIAMVELDDILILVGTIALGAGLTMVYLPATFIVSGVALVGLVAWRRWKKKKGGP